MGRLFIADEDVKGATPTAILSNGMWTRRYGSDPQIVGKSIQVNGISRQVVGVLPKSFSLPREVMPTLDGAEQADILLPLPMAPDAARIVKDAHGNVLADGDTVTLIKDLKLRGGSAVLKGGTKARNIRLVDGDHEIDCKIDGVAMALKACFVKKG